MRTSPEPSAWWKRSAWYAPGISRSSSSACATAVRKSTSHSVGASAWYASPRARLRRNARWLVRRAAVPIVVYVSVQSTESPSRRHSASNACSSSLDELRAQLEEVRPRDRDRVLGAASRAGRTRGRTAGAVRSARRSSSARAARWAGRCRPSPSDRRPRGPACAGSARGRRSARSRRPSPCAASRSPSAAGCRSRRSPGAYGTGRTGRHPGLPRSAPISRRFRRGSACRAHARSSPSGTSLGRQSFGNR